jgi:hypothetical protein
VIKRHYFFVARVMDSEYTVIKGERLSGIFTHTSWFANPLDAMNKFRALMRKDKGIELDFQRMEVVK